MEQTIAAISTAPGPGGIAVIRVSGPEALEIVAQIFVPKNSQKNIKKIAGYSAIFGSICVNCKPIDDVIALVFRAPHSYTGENVVEITCHGGDVISAEVLGACLGAGAKMASKGEFTRRAFLNGKLSFTQAEAVVNLISAASRQEASCAKRALEGNQINELNNIKNKLKNIAAHLAAWMDYPEEDVPIPEETALRVSVKNIRLKLDKIIDEYTRAQRIKRGIKVVICGSPNVGKSTLFNLLVGSERAIITDLAGTTRDVLREEISIFGFPIQLADTAGLRKSEDPIEVEGIRRSGLEMETADLIVMVTEPWDTATPTEEEIQRMREKPSLCVFNKNDMETSEEKVKTDKYYTKSIYISALKEPEQARDAVCLAIAELLALHPLDVDAMLLCSKRQEEKAKQARDELLHFEQEMENYLIYDIAQIKIDGALNALVELTGENVSEAVIEEVFAQFCVGK